MDESNREMLEFMITVLLADYDMMGLITYGDKPYNEYAPEARTILNYLEGHNYEVKLDTLANQIQYIFEVWFNFAPPIRPCILIADEIKKMI